MGGGQNDPGRPKVNLIQIGLYNLSLTWRGRPEGEECQPKVCNVSHKSDGFTFPMHFSTFKNSLAI